MSPPTPAGGIPRIFVSHSSADQAFARRFTADLRRAGADAWIYEADDSPGNIMERVDQMLQTCEWLVLVLSPDAIASSYVRTEVFVALNRVHRKQMHGVVPVVARPVSLDSLPTWEALRRFDATDDYAAGLRGTLNAMGLQSPSSPPSPPPAPAPSPATPSAPAFNPAHTIPRLTQLGFVPRVTNYQGKPTELILPPLCSVPAGPFRMGSDPQQDPRAYGDEQPQHEVNVAAFQIARFPVTVAEYACYQRATGKPAPTDKLDHPVVNVTWHDATAYAAWLAQPTGQPWRLPTEAEWEKAARYDPATRTSRIYPWGNTFDKARANTSEGSKGGTTPVGSYPSGASPCGALDMAGNDWEWTSSLWKPYPYNANDGRERADSTDNRMLRGGSWYNNSASARAAYRGLYGPSRADVNLGFRVALAEPGS